MAATQGLVYLLHFDCKLGHARHYLGWTNNLDQRLHAHASGTSRARLMEVIHEQGIGFELARTWEGDRNLERALKNQGGHTRKCPLCREEDEMDEPADYPDMRPYVYGEEAA